MANKIAAQYWRVMVKGIDYVEKGIEQYEQQILANKFRALKKLAKELKMEGFDNVYVTK